MSKTYRFDRGDSVVKSSPRRERLGKIRHSFAFEKNPKMRRLVVVEDEGEVEDDSYGFLESVDWEQEAKQ